jgi:hypothetical protein
MPQQWTSAHRDHACAEIAWLQGTSGLDADQMLAVCTVVIISMPAICAAPVDAEGCDDAARDRHQAGDARGTRSGRRRPRKLESQAS